MNVSRVCTAGCAARRGSGTEANLRHHGRHTMTAPLKSFRSDHGRCRARRARLRHRHRPRRAAIAGCPCRRLAARRPHRCCHPTAMSPNIGLRKPKPRWRTPALPRREYIVDEGEGSKTYAGLEQVSEALIAARIERKRPGDSTWRRRGRRSRRLCGRDPAPRRRSTRTVLTLNCGGKTFRSRRMTGSFAARQKSTSRVISRLVDRRKHRGAGSRPAKPARSPTTPPPSAITRSLRSILAAISASLTCSRPA